MRSNTMVAKNNVYDVGFSVGPPTATIRASTIMMTTSKKMLNMTSNMVACLLACTGCKGYCCLLNLNEREAAACMQ